MNLFFVLLILLVITRASGELAGRVGQPAIVGELISGIFLGIIAATQAETFPYLASLHNDTVFNAITDLGIFFLMMYAGIEMQPQKILKYSKSATFVAIGGIILPFAIGLGLGWIYLPDSDVKVAQAFFLGTALAITAVPATVKILMDLNKLDTAAGQIIVSAAVFDDLLSLVLLAWLTALISTGTGLSLAGSIILGAKIILFFAITVPVGYFIWPWGGQFMKNLKERELEFSAMLVGALAFSVLAELLGLHFILGAFVAGVFFGRSTIDDYSYEDVRNKVSGLTFGFLAPVFFASVGLNLNLSALSAIPGFLVILILAAFLGKLIGAGLAAYSCGHSKNESAVVGVGMSARGAVEIIIADIAFKAGLFNIAGIDSPILKHMFSAIVIMAIVTTVATPIFLRQIYKFNHDL